MDKSEIAFLFSKGFSISEIQSMEKPTENLVKGDEEETKPQVVDDTQTEKEKPVEQNKKKDSSSYEDLRKEIADLKKTIIKSNHETAENPAPQSGDSADEALAKLMEQF